MFVSMDWISTSTTTPSSISTIPELVLLARVIVFSKSGFVQLPLPVLVYTENQAYFSVEQTDKILNPKILDLTYSDVTGAFVSSTTMDSKFGGSPDS